LFVCVAICAFAATAPTALAAGGAATAQGATVGNGGIDEAFVAGPGENNNLTVTVLANGDVVFRDSGTTVTAVISYPFLERQCFNVTAHKVECPPTQVLEISLGDNADVLHDYTSILSEIRGGGGADTIWGGSGWDSIYGQYGNDTLYGRAGYDELYGGAGNDSLYGGAGHDLLNGDELTQQLPGTDACHIGIDGGTAVNCEIVTG
jgi:Ca2+-binding RTX toxin-like protein